MSANLRMSICPPGGGQAYTQDRFPAGGRNGNYMSPIRVQDVNKVFGERAHRALPLIEQGKSRAEIQDETGLVVAVREATFEIQDGEIFVVMGLSGSGKSTLVRLFNRLIDPTSGTVEIDGQDITKLSEKEMRRLRSSKMSMVFQRFALFPHQTVRDNAAFGLEVRGLSRADRSERAEQALEMVGLAGWGDRYPSELSGGMQQRVGLARALATDADILLMDEAFSALDPLIRREMQDHLLQIQSELHKTIVFITHDLNEAMRLGDRIVVMKDGAIVQLGTAEEILTNPATDYVAAFTQDVDPNRVLTAGSIMRDPIGTVSPVSGPRVAMQRLKEVQRNELYAVRGDRIIAGYVTDRELLEAAQRGEQDLSQVIRADYPRAAPDTPISDLYALSVEYSLPIAVVDDRERLLGVVPRVSLLTALAEVSARADTTYSAIEDQSSQAGMDNGTGEDGDDHSDASMSEGAGDAIHTTN